MHGGSKTLIKNYSYKISRDETISRDPGIDGRAILITADYK
jgi:hypothetical protein